MINYFFHFFSLYAVIFELNKETENITNLSDYKYPSPKDSNYFYLPIISLTDVHGYIFQKKIPSKYEYEFGGGTLLSKYIKTIREEFINNVLIVDSGDEYNGGIESDIAQGRIVSEFFNYIQTNIRILGKSEFKTNMTFIENILKNSSCPFLISNLYNNITKNKYEFNNVSKDKYNYSKIYTI